MKITISLLVLLWTSAFVNAQTYTVANSVEYAGVVVRLDDAARKIVQTDVNALMANRKTLDNKLEKMLMYFPIVESILAEEDIPNDFKYLCVQESSLIADAVSSSNAVGYWQFKQETARDFGLRVDGEIDERKNIHAATHGACLYLKKNNAILNNWISALNSYRLGLGGVSAVIPKDWAYATEIAVSANTDWYILRALAHKIVFEQELGRFAGGGRFQLLDYKLNTGKSFEQIAQELEIDNNLLRQYNSWMGSSVVPDDKEYVMLIPATSDQVENIRVKTALGSNTNFIKNDIGFPILKRVTPSLKDKTLPIFYEINGLAGIQAQEGESPLSLSMKADLRLDKLMDYNDLGEKDRIVPGDIYYLEKKKRKAAVPFHTVANDQTLWKISQIYGIRMKFLMRWNRLEQIVKLQPGRVIYLQKKRPKDKPVEYINMPVEQQIQNQKPKNKKDKNDKTTVLTPENSPVASQPSNAPVSTDTPASTTGIDTGSRRVVVVEEDNNNNNKAGTYTPSNTPSKVATEPETNPKETKPVGVNQEKPQNARMKVVTHTVTPGQNYFAVARQYGVSPQEVFSWNNVDPALPPPLRLGQKLKIFIVSDGGAAIPQPTPSPAQVIVDQPQASPITTENPQYHTVVKGDTAYSISKKYGISIEKLKELNNLGGTGISLGQKLKLR